MIFGSGVFFCSIFSFAFIGLLWGWCRGLALHEGSQDPSPFRLQLSASPPPPHRHLQTQLRDGAHMGCLSWLAFIYAYNGGIKSFVYRSSFFSSFLIFFRLCQTLRWCTHTHTCVCNFYHHYNTLISSLFVVVFVRSYPFFPDCFLTLLSLLSVTYAVYGFCMFTLCALERETFMSFYVHLTCCVCVSYIFLFLSSPFSLRFFRCYFFVVKFSSVCLPLFFSVFVSFLSVSSCGCVCVLHHQPPNRVLMMISLFTNCVFMYLLLPPVHREWVVFSSLSLSDTFCFCRRKMTICTAPQFGVLCCFRDADEIGRGLHASAD